MSAKPQDPQPQTVGDALADMAGGVAPLPAADNLAVPLSGIPLPPEELVDELDNSGPAQAGAPAAEPGDRAVLDFVGDELPEYTHKLRYPFRWEGRRIDAITVRQIATGQLGEIYARAAREKRTPMLYDFYAEMTGLPGPVLRALPVIDGEPIIDKAWDFLPPSARPADG